LREGIFIVEKINIGIIGTSEFTEEAHISGFTNNPDANVIVLCGKQNKKRLNELAKSYEIPHTVTDYNQLLNFKQLDAVVVATPNFLHYPIVMKLLKNNLHILCEKPLATNLIDAKRMYEEAEKKQIKHMTSFTFRFTSPVIKAYDLIQKGYIGDVFHFNAHYLVDFDVNSSLTWRFIKEKAGYGALGDLSPHSIDLARLLIGEIKKVCGLEQTFVKKWRFKNNKFETVDVDDSAMFIAQFKNGVQGIFQASMVATGRGSTMRIEISGSKGTLVINRELGDITLYQQKQIDGKYSILDKCKEDRGIIFTSMAKTFTENILKDQKTPPSFYEGLKSQEIIEAVDLSHKQKKWVTLPVLD
jgi:predicted dehydrogenase